MLFKLAVFVGNVLFLVAILASWGYGIFVGQATITEALTIVPLIPLLVANVWLSWKYFSSN